MTDPAPKDDTQGLPTLDVVPSDDTVEIIRAVQAFVLKHPAAAKAIFAGLIAEGRAYARTPKGATARSASEQSQLVHQARLLMDLPGLSMLEPEDGAILPSALVDTVFMMASNESSPDFLKALFELGGADES